jgi:hypothetical protein
MPIRHLRRIVGAGFLLGGSVPVAAQSPFLFATQPPGSATRVETSVDAGYNVRAFEPVAGERMEPRATIDATLSSRFSIRAQLAAASTIDHRTRLSDQAELMITPLRSRAIALGSTLGFRHEYSGADVALGRVVASRTTHASALAADVLVEHAFVAARDPIDVITTVGASRALAQRVWLGVEAVGSDLEGFFDRDEAEGGARLLVGPTLSVGVSDRWRILAGGGPVLRATTNQTLTAGRGTSSLGLTNGQAGYVLRVSIRHVW